MKRISALPTLIALAMLCSCQKQDLTAEQQLAQRNTELNAREKALNQREQALQQRERAVANGRMLPPDAQSLRRGRDLGQIQIDRDEKLQKLPPELRALIPPPGQMRSGRIDRASEATQQQAQSQTADPRHMEAERERKLQQLPPELRALIPPSSHLRSATGQASGPSPTSGESPSPSPSPTPQ